MKYFHLNVPCMKKTGYISDRLHFLPAVEKHWHTWVEHFYDIYRPFAPIVQVGFDTFTVWPPLQSPLHH